MKKNQFFRKLFLSYIIFIIIPILIFGYLSYFNISEGTYAADTEYGLKTLEYSMNSINIFLGQMDNVLLQNALDIDINAIVAGKSLDSEYNKLEVVKKLANITSTNSRILSVYLTDLKSYVFSSSGGYSKIEDFHDRSWASALQNTNLMLTGWIVRTIPQPYSERKSDDKIMVITKCAQLSNHKGYFVLNINVNSLYGMMEELEGSSSSFNIVESGGRTIVNARNSIFNAGEDAADFLQKLSGKPGNLGRGHDIVTYEGRKHVVSYVQSPANKWVYIKTVPLKILNQRADQVKSLTLISSFVCFAVGLVLSYLLSFNLYKPIKILRNNISSLFHDNETAKDEIGYIGHAVDTLIHDRKTSEDKLKQNYGLVKEKLLHELLEGDMQANAGLYREFIDIGRPDCHYLVITAALYPKATDKAKSFAETLKAGLTEGLLCCQAETIPINENIAVIVQADRGRPERGKVAEFLAGMIHTAKNEFGFDCTFGIGDCTEDFTQIPFSYAASLFALSYSLVEGRNNTYFHGDIKAAASSDSMLLYQKRLEDGAILKLINDQDAQKLVAHFREDIRPFTGRQAFNKTQICNLYNHYIVTLFKYILDNSIKADMDMNIADLMGVSTIQEMTERIGKLSGTIVAQLSENDNSRIISNLVEYIDKHYFEDITLESAADKVYLSKSHLSRLFKQYYGINFNKYLIGKRMDMAEQMLLATNLQIRQISAQVGYNNLNSFTKIFKEYKGVSPFDYRKQNSIARLGDKTPGAQ